MSINGSGIVDNSTIGEEIDVLSDCTDARLAGNMDPVPCDAIVPLVSVLAEAKEYDLLYDLTRVNKTWHGIVQPALDRLNDPLVSWDLFKRCAKDMEEFYCGELFQMLKSENGMSDRKKSVAMTCLEELNAVFSDWPSSLSCLQVDADPCRELYFLCYNYGQFVHDFSDMNDLVSWIMEMSYIIHQQGEESFGSWQKHGSRITTSLPFEYDLHGLLPLGVRTVKFASDWTRLSITTKQQLRWRFTIDCMYLYHRYQRRVTHH